MIAAKAGLVSKQTQRAAAAASGVNAGRIGQAAVVLDHAPDLADAVVAGTRSLDEATVAGGSPYREAIEKAELGERTAHALGEIWALWAGRGTPQKKCPGLRHRPECH